MSTLPSSIGHDIGKGVRRLMAAAADLPMMTDASPLAVRHDGEVESHGQLFAQYVARINWAVGLAIPWWNDIVQRRVGRGEDIITAIRASYVLRPAGAASRPEVVWVVRSHWLDCVRLNGRIAGRDRVPPQVFLLEWLCDGGHEPPVAVLSGMPYWPIGLDETGGFT